MIEWLLSKLVGQPPTLKLEDQEERVDAIVARVNVLEERVETIERDFSIHDGAHESH